MLTKNKWVCRGHPLGHNQPIAVTFPKEKWLFLPISYQLPIALQQGVGFGNWSLFIFVCFFTWRQVQVLYESVMPYPEDSNPHHSFLTSADCLISALLPITHDPCFCDYRCHTVFNQIAMFLFSFCMTQILCLRGEKCPLMWSKKEGIEWCQLSLKEWFNEIYRINHLMKHCVVSGRHGNNFV